MSITSPIPDENGIAFSAVGQPCYYCGAPAGDPALSWSGFGDPIYLHADCFLELSIRLMRDLHELRCPDFYARLRAGGGR